MATLQQIKTKADDKLVNFWTALNTREDAYFTKHGKYFQLLAGSALTVDGADTPFSVISPQDEHYAADIDYAWSDTVPFKLSVHEWGGVDGYGYRAIVVITANGNTYSRERDNSNNDTGWFQILPVTF